MTDLHTRMALMVGVVALVATGWWAFGPKEQGYVFDVPQGIPPPHVPDDNPMTDAKVELGRYLFYSKQLSINGEQSCASCHRQELAFTDGRPTAVGTTGEVHFRGSMTLTNAGYAQRLTWASSLVDDLAAQALLPMFGETPVELGLAGKEDVLMQRMRDDQALAPRFKAAFPDDKDPFTLQNLTHAIACFERTLVSFDSPYDRYLQGDFKALTDEEKKGMELFFSERTECHHCHNGFNFSASTDHTGDIAVEEAFHNTGLYNVDGKGAYPKVDPGLYAVTRKPADMGRFRAPTLRNVAVTAPYMHDGSIATLDDVIDHYANGGRHLQSGEHVGDGSKSPLKSDFIVGFALKASEKKALLAFLRTLTDDTFLNDPRFADPYAATSTSAAAK